MVRLIRLLWLMQLISRAIRLLLPWIRRMVMHMVSYMAVTVWSFWGNVLPTVRRMAEEWQRRALSNGVPTQYDQFLYWTFYGLALVMIVLGWLGMSFLTVFIVHLLF